jgi:CheY-like chemotaxis protein
LAPTIYFSNGEIGITMFSSSKEIPTTRILNYEPVPDSQALTGMRILVVDDEPDCATLTGYMLSQWGADVKVVISATEALDIFERYEEWTPDILISDIQMPGIDGYSLMRRVRKMAPDRGADIPAIALTAYARVEDRIRALVAGFQIHIAKPFEPVELLTVVESIMNRRIEDRGLRIED